MTFEKWFSNYGIKGMFESGSGYTFPQDIEIMAKVMQRAGWDAATKERRIEHKLSRLVETWRNKVVSCFTSSCHLSQLDEVLTQMMKAAQNEEKILK